jgi:glycosyltransferase 2 family protein
MTQDPATRSRSDWRKILPGVIVSLAALAVVFYFVDLARLVQALGQANPWLIALFLMVSTLWLFVRALVWRTLLQEKASHSQVFLTLGEGYLLNNVLPFRLGEVARAFLISRKAPVGFLEALSTILIERALDVALAVGLLLCTLPFVVGGSFVSEAAVLAGTLVLGVLVALHLLARNQAWARRQFEKLSARLPALRKVIGPQQIEAFFSGLTALVDLKCFIKVILLMLLNWGVALLQFYFLVRAFYANAQPLWAAFTLGVMALGIAAPSSPGAVGVMELSVIAALSAFGLDPAIALAVALTAHVANYLVSGIVGAYGLGRDGMTLTGLYRNVRSISSP